MITRLKNEINKNNLHLAGAILIIILVASFLVETLTPVGVATSPDSLSYIYAAKKIKEGEGVIIPEMRLEKPGFEAPMTAWPPFYPIALSIVISDKYAEKSVSVFNAGCLIMLGLLFLYGSSSFNNLKISLMGTLLLLIQSPILTVYTYAWSEVLFLPLIFGSFIFAYKVLDGQKSSIVALILLFVAACYTRYSGLFFLLPMLMMLSTTQSLIKEKVTYIFKIGLIIFALLSPMIVRNIMQSGFIGGADRLSSDSKFVDNMVDIGNLVGLHFFGWPQWWISLSGVVLLSWFFILIAKKHDHEIKNDIYKIGWPLIWVISYLVTVALIRSIKSFDAIDTRLISPVVPFLTLSLIGLLSVSLKWGKTPFVPAALFFWSGLLVLLGATTYSHAVVNWRNDNTPKFTSTIGYTYNNFTDSAIYPMVASLYANIQNMTQLSNPVVVFEGACCAVFLKQVTMDAKVKWLPAALNVEHIKQINNLGAGVIVIVTEQGLDDFRRFYKDDFHKLYIKPIQEGKVGWFIELPLLIPVGEFNE